MSTVVSIHPLVDNTAPKVNPIRFTHLLTGLDIKPTGWRPIDFKNVELLHKGYQYGCKDNPEIGKHDLMIAYNESKSVSIFFIGQFNDGIV